MLIDKQIRVDKWLWAVRIFKTRNQATEACKKGRILIREQPVKPSRVLRINDIIQVKRPPAVYSFKVTGLLAKRLSARLVKDYIEDITPEQELEKLKVRETFFISRDKGSGRPTKKERRTMEKLRGE
ncbi:MAG: RNA-binding S4 domain-containing protein [Bacteroidales bacterium]|nr:RNA-binding S4 domain-containing protein [Bacteroidales bacterium]